MSVSEEAVERAAEVLAVRASTQAVWDTYSAATQQILIKNRMLDARAALEAAAPYMRREVVAKGVEW